MQIELLKSDLVAIHPEMDFLRLNPSEQKVVAIRVLRRKGNPASSFVADQILRGNPNFEFVVADDISHLT